jgi:hypothetical protein
MRLSIDPEKASFQARAKKKHAPRRDVPGHRVWQSAIAVHGARSFCLKLTNRNALGGAGLIISAGASSQPKPTNARFSLHSAKS